VIEKGDSRNLPPDNLQEIFALWVLGYSLRFYPPQAD